MSGGCCDPSREKRRGDTLKIVECVLLLLYCIYVQDSIQLVGLPCSIAAPLSKVKQVRLTTRGRQLRYVGRQFVSLKSIANDGKAFANDDGRVNRKKS